MALPSGYTELEYIEIPDGAYINTNFSPNQNTRVICDFELTALPTEHLVIFGSRNSASSGQYVFGYTAHSTNLFRSDYGNNQVSFAQMEAMARYTVDKNKNVVSMNGATTTNTSNSFQCNYPLYIGGMNNGGNASVQTSEKIFMCMVYGNGSLMRDYIPCKNVDGEVGLYDQINSQFYGNSGTGQFVAGPEIVPDEGIASLQDAQLIIGTSATITLNLAVVEPVSGTPVNISINSVSGTVNNIATTWTLSGTLWTATAPLSELGQYLCVFDVATSDGKTVEMRLPLYYGMMSLITDRTQADVDELLSILQTPFADWTTEQAQLFYSGMSKGAYNASDLNRVGAAMVYIAERMASMGYAVDNIAPKLYWMDTDTVTQSDMTAYLSDVSALQTVLPLPAETPTAPSDIAGLTYTEANNIEQILLIINTIITNITLAYRYAGELYGGEV